MSATTQMNWILSSANSNEYELYELWNEDKLLMTLELNLFSHKAKIQCSTSRRIFKIDKEGFLRTKTIFKNEYGIRVGELAQENWFNNDGVIFLNDEYYRYSIKNNPLAQLIVYKNKVTEPLISCGLKASNGNTSISFSKHNDHEKQPVFLMALAWFLFLPVAKEHVTTLVH